VIRAFIRKSTGNVKANWQFKATTSRRLIQKIKKSKKKKKVKKKFADTKEKQKEKK
jgi:hypothetical protein